ncbi:DUF1573 domain-containing protein [uncultured Algibacter sp.]|uniref:DUF1573 domain-containing protein n=1 Tax=uncultured Algibacter sp. TaxID=298659 RepID=UPI0026104E6B|nr:DUF1573 domain-containing protein [uncultured Algibacter sp.]
MKHAFKYFTTIKFALVALAFVFSFSSSFGQSSTNTSATGVLTFDSETIDYGKIYENANGERTFSFTNTGKAPIVINKVKTSCGCTVPTYPKTAILPGESGEIKIKYATNRIGVFSKTITVISNAENSNHVLKIKGDVLKNTI